MKQHIIIGSSAVGIGAILQLQKVDPTSRITCITKSSHTPYNTCFLAPSLDGRKSRLDIMLEKNLFSAQKNISFLKNSTVKKIDPIKQKVTLSSGHELSFDTLTLGLGTTNFQPDFIGPKKNLEGITFFKTLEDVDYILNYLKTKKINNVTIIGTGLVGLELAESLSNRELSVNLIGRSDHIMTKLFDTKAAAIFEQKLINKKIKFFKNSHLLEIFGHQNINAIKISTGELLKTDLLIFATGGTPNIELAEQAGIKIENGCIAVNDYFQTNHENIYAGGDACLIKNILDDSKDSSCKIQSCTWPDAIIHGINIANSIAGNPTPYQGALIGFSSEIFGTRFATCGNHLATGEDYKTTTKEKNNNYQRFVIQNNQLKGYLLLGDTSKAGHYRKMILDKTLITNSGMLL